MWKLRWRGWWAAWVAPLGPSRWPGEWWRMVGTSLLWSDEQLGSPLFSNVTLSSSLESPLLIQRASSLPTEGLCWSSRWQKASILPSAPALLQCIQGRLEPGRSLYSAIILTGLCAQEHRKWGGSQKNTSESPNTCRLQKWRPLGKNITQPITRHYS